MVFSSIGDTTRVSPLQNRAGSGLLATHPVLPSAVSGAVTVARSFFTTVFPADCPLCASPLNNISRLPVCAACIAAMGPICGPTCDACGEGLSLSNPWEKLTLCGACQQQLPPYRKALAYGSYDAELRQLIHLFKCDQVHPVASILGTMLAIAISKLELSGQVLVLPVPLHSSKRRLRGFNQAELIAHSALKAMDHKRFQLVTNLMERVRPTLSQIGLTRPQRQDNLRGAFEVPHLSRVRGGNILLVDDVLMTGTTAAECARVLRRAGAKNVWVATVARTLKNSVGEKLAGKLTRKLR